MQNLPPGWTVSNNTGSFAGPSHVVNGSEDDISDAEENLDVEPDSPGWEDVEPSEDVEAVAVKCLICEEVFGDTGVMLNHCRSEHSFDFLEIRRLKNLDFYSTIKLINYIRAAVNDGKPPDVPDLADPSVWADDKYLKPVIDQDALLYTWDELVDAEDDPMTSVPAVETLISGD